MKCAFYNGFGFLVLCATICLTIPVIVVEGRPSYATLAWVVGGLLFIIDACCRVRLYWVEPAPQDKILFFLSATNGGQLPCLPLGSNEMDPPYAD